MNSVALDDRRDRRGGCVRGRRCAALKAPLAATHGVSRAVFAYYDFLNGFRIWRRGGHKVKRIVGRTGTTGRKRHCCAALSIR